MEAQEEGVVMASSKMEEMVQTQILKGKRTKRQRPQSPIPFKIPRAFSSKIAKTSSDTSGDMIDDGDVAINTNTNMQPNSSDEYYLPHENTDDDDDDNNLQPTSSDEYYLHDSVTEEEMDVANCLILLSHGQSHRPPEHRQAVEKTCGNKFNGRKFSEMGTGAGAGKVGCNAYECKTCGKRFSSFQALGGHRASHKKSKVKEEEEKRRAYLQLSGNGDSQRSSTALALQSNHKSSSSDKPRVHRCSNCGAEFASGQALGGHMRRHRGAAGRSLPALSLTTPIMTADHREDWEEKRVVPSPPAKGNVISLNLDLNLPAPEDDHMESYFHLASEQPPEQQKPRQLDFPPPTLVDCHF
ncbi:hypothetical protein Nepgr_001285 [Nepenthes gracilis]|uniref:C2H2-type domain-containing protein n=1 Tax=Nepenthes gracilis TaxID=150966 RepID=A0AAD3P4K0_NEPGR|nr:hypothetical protein Nepgr_001285 [Nepenthes gracilis]